MALSIDRILKLDANIDRNDPIWLELTRDLMVEHAKNLGFSYEMTNDSGLEVFTHESVMVEEDEESYAFGVAFEPVSENGILEASNARQFVLDLQRFYKLRDGEKRTQLEILNDIF